jgi:hypothetical protein
MDAVTAVVDEAIRETIGASPKKWGLVVVAIVAGAMGAFWLARRMRAASPTTAQPDAATS